MAVLPISNSVNKDAREPPLCIQCKRDKFRAIHGLSAPCKCQLLVGSLTTSEPRRPVGQPVRIGCNSKADCCTERSTRPACLCQVITSAAMERVVLRFNLVVGKPSS